MKGLPSELIYVLVFVGIVLAQYLIKRLAGRRAPEPSRNARARQVPVEKSADLAEREHATPIARQPSRTSPQRRDRSEAPAERRPRPRRRFARQSLLATRSDVQDAVVIAAIIGPCRALEPRE